MLVSAIQGAQLKPSDLAKLEPTFCDMIHTTAAGEFFVYFTKKNPVPHGGSEDSSFRSEDDATTRTAGRIRRYYCTAAPTTQQQWEVDTGDETLFVAFDRWLEEPLPSECAELFLRKRALVGISGAHHNAGVASQQRNTGSSNNSAERWVAACETLRAVRSSQQQQAPSATFRVVTSSGPQGTGLETSSVPIGGERRGGGELGRARLESSLEEQSLATRALKEALQAKQRELAMVMQQLRDANAQRELDAQKSQEQLDSLTQQLQAQQRKVAKVEEGMMKVVGLAGSLKKVLDAVVQKLGLREGSTPDFVLSVLRTATFSRDAAPSAGSSS